MDWWEPFRHSSLGTRSRACSRILFRRLSSPKILVVWMSSKKKIKSRSVWNKKCLKQASLHRHLSSAKILVVWTIAHQVWLAKNLFPFGAESGEGQFETIPCGCLLWCTNKACWSFGSTMSYSIHLHVASIWGKQILVSGRIYD